MTKTFYSTTSRRLNLKLYTVNLYPDQVGDILPFTTGGMTIPYPRTYVTLVLLRVIFTQPPTMLPFSIESCNTCVHKMFCLNRKCCLHIKCWRHHIYIFLSIACVSNTPMSDEKCACFTVFKVWVTQCLLTKPMEQCLVLVIDSITDTSLDL